MSSFLDLSSPPPPIKKERSIEILTSSTQNVTLFGNRAVVDVICEDGVIGEEAGPLIQSGWCLHGKIITWRQRHREKAMG